MTHLSEQTWRSEAACLSTPEVNFFIDSYGRPGGRQTRVKAAAAKAVCAVCPVVRECLEHALTQPEVFGVWGNTTADERSDIRRERRSLQRIDVQQDRPAV